MEKTEDLEGAVTGMTILLATHFVKSTIIVQVSLQVSLQVALQVNVLRTIVWQHVTFMAIC